ADHSHLDLVGQRIAGEAGLDVGIIEVVGELALDLDILLVALGAPALVALAAVAFEQRVGIEPEVVDGFGKRGDVVGHGYPLRSARRTWFSNVRYLSRDF